ncbi:tetratricopeptide repeat protein [Lewinella cohaerens]|uniref:tetratricopeptide repeat protein n=1 Tax=Lewinella cohaerens TaxID=70995 RepID=UPI0003688FF4|nr:tetratricopeptide repeat protein [Lewinella cohaerens]
MTIQKNLAVLLAILFLGTASLSAQCTNWEEIANKGEAEDAHVVYRPYLKDKTAADVEALAESDFNLAFSNWEKAYTLAPAADGQRPTHYIDGIILYKAKTAKTEDTEQKAEYSKVIMKLYDEYLECYPDDSKLILGRKAFDMFYSHGYGYTLETLEALQAAMEAAGNESEYILLDPLGLTLVYLYQDGQIDKATVRDLYTKAVEFADHNIENDHYYKDYYVSGKANMDAKISEIASEVFDCDYFKGDLLPSFAENKEDWETINYIWQKLMAQGCEETDPELAELKATYEELALTERMKDPCFAGSVYQKEGDYDKALASYQECIDSTEDPEVKAQILFSMASILTWQKGQYGQANAKAREAASLKSGWGKPYMLMGDIISKRATACDDWNRRLAAIAAIDKYSYARSIDADVASDAGTRISRLTAALPGREDGFMRKVSEGQSVTVSCIGETVKVRFRD